ncbi:MAG: FtsW/RodA/SpoVE family cell cycle protein [Puniceicoccales bacterium]|jgi:cell division protein FtsW|nr:FtsW/RodA/SpoVE family cell cycle protein [Puniceicoccales bacterium]
MWKVLGEYCSCFNGSRKLFAIPICVTFLTVLGLLTLSSASLSFVGSNYLLRQCVWLVIAIFTGAAAMAIPLDFLRSHSRQIAIGALVLCVAVLIPKIGLSINGSRRWINLCFFHFQVSELAKIALVLRLADCIAERDGMEWNLLEGFVKPVLTIAAFSALLILEPDYGSTLLFLFVGFAILFLSGVPLRHLAACISIAAVTVAIFIALNPVRLSRILSFLDIESTKLTGSYQLWQGLIGFQSGGLHGLGLGNGRQQLFYLPEAHTDFIFPVFAEELGYPFAAAAILAYIVIFMISWSEICRISDPFLFLVANGALLFIVAQTAINLAVVMGLFPTKGMALPLISYGGSNLVLIFTLLGLLCNCFRTAHFQKPNLEDLIGKHL